MSERGLSSTGSVTRRSPGPGAFRPHGSPTRCVSRAYLEAERLGERFLPGGRPRGSRRQSPITEPNAMTVD